jgi:uncharacterized protein with HEPN domain
MPRRRWKPRVRHILDAIDKIRVYTAGMSLEAFSANDLVVDAVLWSMYTPWCSPW